MAFVVVAAAEFVVVAVVVAAAVLLCAVDFQYLHASAVAAGAVDVFVRTMMSIAPSHNLDCFQCDCYWCSFEIWAT